jgi:hypothetical protein
MALFGGHTVLVYDLTGCTNEEENIVSKNKLFSRGLFRVLQPQYKE